jgi:hypothetical protein
MSLNVLKEFLIHFHTFRNIDLLNQGLYQIRTRIYYVDKYTKLSAVPYNFADSKENEYSLISDENTKYNIISNHIGENNTDYVTKTFAIRYTDEEVDIDEFCYYRMEIPFEKHLSDLQVTIEVSLYFSDSYLNLIKDKKEGQNSLEFKCIGITTLTVNVTKSGYIESYTPVIYKDFSSSILNCSVHIVSLDYKLRSDNICLFVEEEVEAKPQAAVPLNSKKYSSERGGSVLDFSSNATSSFNHSVGQFLLDLDGNRLPVDLNEKIINDVYRKYVVSLVEVYLNLKKNYFKLLNLLLDDKVKSEFSFFTVR